jgi:hypothetical protein
MNGDMAHEVYLNDEEDLSAEPAWAHAATRARTAMISFIFLADLFKGDKWEC